MKKSIETGQKKLLCHFSIPILFMDKISSGSINEADLMTEAQGMMSKLNTNDLFKNGS